MPARSEKDFWNTIKTVGSLDRVGFSRMKFDVFEFAAFETFETPRPYSKFKVIFKRFVERHEGVGIQSICDVRASRDIRWPLDLYGLDGF